ncbi:hypothetical protein OS493_001893 [Desmophyllum pertusum]|uniref:Uncharacterized protein n=1 Tax=Desmophyllum pertusum TaxID=174260 RepID=A0A9W9Z558_9CNID|nr:hypothetical protein OS493_001893 [Desmophyllum pertusum]
MAVHKSRRTTVLEMRPDLVLVSAVPWGLRAYLIPNESQFLYETPLGMVSVAENLGELKVAALDSIVDQSG